MSSFIVANTVRRPTPHGQENSDSSRTVPAPPSRAARRPKSGQLSDTAPAKASTALRDLLGHASTRTTERYARPSTEALDAAIRAARLRGGGGGKSSSVTPPNERGAFFFVRSPLLQPVHVGRNFLKRLMFVVPVLLFVPRLLAQHDAPRP